MAHEWITKSNQPMKANVLALSIELRRSMAEKDILVFSDERVRALLGGLSAVYEEVFVWADGNHVAVWVTGLHAEVLVQAFSHIKPKAKQWQLLQGDPAVALFEAIVVGAQWGRRGMAEKLFSLEHAGVLALESRCLGRVLGAMVEDGVQALRSQPLVIGAENGWIPASLLRGSLHSQSIAFPALFYRYSLN